MSQHGELGVTNRKYTQSEWDDIEQKISPELKSVALGMVSFGKQIVETGDYKFEKIPVNNFQIKNLSKMMLETFSEKFKKIIPKDLFEILIKVTTTSENLEPESKKKKKNKKGNSGQQMREQVRLKNILKKIDEDFELMSTTTCDGVVDSHFSLIESKLLNNLVWYFKLLSQKKIDSNYLLYDCLLSLSRAIEYFQKNYIGISEDIFSYCSQVLTFGVSLINIQDIQINYPELITQSSFDKMSYQAKLKLYDCQKEVLLHIYKSMKSKKPLIVNYQTPPGAGKTTLVIALARMAFEFQKQIIYICYNGIVRKEVSRMLFHSGTTFAIVSDCHIKPHNSCFVSKKNKGRPSEHEDKSLRLNSELARIKSKCDKQPSVLVCDLTSASQLLKTLDAQQKYIAYIDEPTAGAEEVKSKMTSKYMEIILNCPTISVCLSATMPKNEETPLIYETFKSRFQCHDDSIKTVLSSLIPINCELIDGNGNIVCPHNFVENSGDLSKIISFMEEKPFLTRFYTPRIMYRLRSILDDYSEYQLDSYTPVLSDLNHSHIRQECLQLLKIMVKLDSSEIINQLRQKIPVSSSSNQPGFDFETCLGSSAHYNLGQTLLINRNSKCHTLVLKRAQQFLKDNQVLPLKKQLEQYNRVLLDYQKRLAGIDKDKNIKGEDETSRAKNNLEIPVFNWDPSLTINSIEHLSKHSNLESEDIRKLDKFLKLSPLLQGLDIETIKGFPDLYDIGVLMGIGVIDPSSSLLRSNGNIYNEEVLKLASQGSLSYISSNKSISYGTNLPIQKVVIDNTGQSQNTLHQQLGRVGRLGKSLSGSAVIEDDEVIMLAFSPIDQNIEAQNMNHAGSELMID